MENSHRTQLLIALAAAFFPAYSQVISLEQPTSIRNTAAEAIEAREQELTIELKSTRGAGNQEAIKREIQAVKNSKKEPDQNSDAIQKSAETSRLVDIETYFATDRKASGDSVPFFGSDREPNDLNLGSVTARVSYRIGQTKIPSDWKLVKEGEPGNAIGITKPKVMNEQYWLDAIKQGRKSSGPIFFVHGFNVGFPEALIRAVQLKSDIGFDSSMILYSWPSAGQFGAGAYSRDRDKVEVSAIKIASLMRKLKSSGVESMTAICHSMGCQILLRAMNELSFTPQSNPVTRLVLIAPDESWENFSQKFAPMLAAQKQFDVTVYASRRDLAMWASYIFGGMSISRTGDPTKPLKLPPSIEYIDATAATSWYQSFGHSYLFDTREAILDIAQLVAQGTVAASRVGLSKTPNPAGENGSVIWTFR